jgi:UDP-N-acetylmuramate dehydrogenase
MRQSNVSLKALSAIRIGGKAELVIYPQTLAELCTAVGEFPAAPIVGGGSNIFFEDKTYPVVICTQKLRSVQEHPDGSLTAACGVRLGDLLDIGVGVPATVGGAVLMNFGAFGKEIKDYVIAVEVFDRADRQVKKLERTQIQFGYRTSSFQQLRRYVIVAVHFLQRELEHKQEYLDLRKKNMPYDYPNIGSIFRNPAGVSAGVLLEGVGAKSLAVGGARVSQKHANIIVNSGEATAVDMQQLMLNLQQLVQQSTGIFLEPEVECLTCL